MELIAGICAGSLGTVALVAGLVLWFFRGHRIDATGLRVVRSDQWRPPTVFYEAKEPRPYFPGMTKEPDLYDLAHAKERGGDET